MRMTALTTTERQPVAGRQPFLDRYSLGHAAAGAAYAASGLSFWQSLAAHGIWEAFESPIKLEYPALYPVPEIDTPTNIAGDLLSAMIGWQAWRTVLGEERSGGGWVLAGAALWAASAWALRWPQARPGVRARWEQAATQYAGQSTPLPPMVQ